MFAALNSFLTRAVTGYFLNKSLRFRASASAYLNRTPATATNQKTWTISVWYKAGGIEAGPVNANILNAGGDGSSVLIAGTGAFGATYNSHLIYREAAATLLYWPMVFRDPAAWYHIVFVMDTTQATAANRTKLYVNGVDQGTFTGTAVTQNSNTSVNSVSAHYINTFNGTYYPSDLEYAAYNFIDGQALAPTAFGEYSIYNQWLPIAYAGTYGTNGFYLPFTNTTSTSTLVADSSGNGNNWTPNNISLTAGSTYDSLTDVPTLTSTTVANYAVLNPLYRGYGGYTATPVNISNANLTIAGNASANNIAATFALPTAGNFYWEYVWTANSGGEMDGGIIGESGTPYFYRYDGTYYNGSTYVAYGLSYTTSDVIGVSVNMTNRTFTFYKNNVSQGTTAAFPSGVTYFPWFYVSNSVGANVNFGQQPFTYTAPSGFLPLNTYNI